MKSLAVIACVFAFLASANALSCYICSSSDSGAIGDACTDTDPETSDIPTLDDPTEKICYVCGKSVAGNDASRSCLSKSDFNSLANSLDISKSDHDQCKEQGNLEFCVCDSNNCNGVGRVGVSLALIAFLSFVKFLF